MKAFPLPSLTVKDNGIVLAFTVENPGMDLRDYFAAKTIPSLVKTFENHITTPDDVAKLAYKYADAMMKERIQNGSQN
jgi:hypothetical protein